MLSKAWTSCVVLFICKDAWMTHLFLISWTCSLKYENYLLIAPGCRSVTWMDLPSQRRTGIWLRLHGYCSDWAQGKKGITWTSNWTFNNCSGLPFKILLRIQVPPCEALTPYCDTDGCSIRDFPFPAIALKYLFSFDNRVHQESCTFSAAGSSLVGRKQEGLEGKKRKMAGPEILCD